MGTIDTVILVHGLGQSRLSMWLLGRRLQHHGFHVVRSGYRSWWGALLQHSTRLESEMMELLSDPRTGVVHLVGHSMGSVIIRAALSTLPSYSKLGRVVLLGPPNHGSKAARKAARFFGKICPVLHELSDDPCSLVNRLPRLAHIDVGIIAARYDRVVAEQSTHLAEERDHTVVACGHTMLLFRREVAQQVCSFFSNGCFRCPEESTEIDLPVVSIG